MQTSSQKKLTADLPQASSSSSSSEAEEDRTLPFLDCRDIGMNHFSTQKGFSRLSSITPPLITPFIVETYRAANVEVDAEAETSNKSYVVSLDKGEASRGYLQ